MRQNSRKYSVHKGEINKYSRFGVVYQRFECINIIIFQK